MSRANELVSEGKEEEGASTLWEGRRATMAKLEATMLDVVRQLVDPRSDGGVRFACLQRSARSRFDAASLSYRSAASAAAPPPASVKVLWSPGKPRTLSVSFLRLVSVASTVLGAYRAGMFLTKREIFYLQRGRFDSQRQCDAALDRLSALLACPRSHLGVSGASRGLLHWSGAQPFEIEWAGGPPGSDIARRALAIGGAGRGPSAGVPGDVAHASRVSVPPGLAAVLVVEKETVFRRLESERFPTRFGALMVTGRGVPDLATRRLLSLVTRASPRTPVYALMDADPFGTAIFDGFRSGYRSSVLEGDLALPHMRWAGVGIRHLEALGKLGVPGVALPLAPGDRAQITRVRALLSAQAQGVAADRAVANAELEAELDAMERLGLKAELEGIPAAFAGVPAPYSWYLTHRLGLA